MDGYSPIVPLLHNMVLSRSEGGSTLKRMRQIVTKAVVAKGKKRTEQEVKICPQNRPSSILGCWVINHTCSAKKHGHYVEVTGKFEVNVWYAYNSQSKTAVFTETVHYKDRVKLHYRDKDIKGAEDLHVRVLQEPNCVEAVICPNGERFEVLVEREILVEVVGETTVCVSVHPLDFDEEWQFDDESSSSSSSSSSSNNENCEEDERRSGHGMGRGRFDAESSSF